MNKSETGKEKRQEGEERTHRHNRNSRKPQGKEWKAQNQQVQNLHVSNGKKPASINFAIVYKEKCCTRFWLSWPLSRNIFYMLQGFFQHGTHFLQTKLQDTSNDSSCFFFGSPKFTKYSTKYFHSPQIHEVLVGL